MKLKEFGRQVRARVPESPLRSANGPQRVGKWDYNRVTVPTSNLHKCLLNINQMETILYKKISQTWSYTT